MLETIALPNLFFEGQANPILLPGPSQFREPENKLPVKNEVDVIVCGGGPAGIAAAITAARAGAKTQLIEVHGCLGGLWTAGLLTWIFDFDKPGIAREIMARLDKRNARSHYCTSGIDADFTYVPEEMKLLFGRDVR